MFLFHIGKQAVQVDFDDLRLRRDNETGFGRPVLRACGDTKITQYDLIKNAQFLPGTVDKPRWYFISGDSGPCAFMAGQTAELEHAYQQWRRNWLLNVTVDLSKDDDYLRYSVDFRRRTSTLVRLGEPWSVAVRTALFVSNFIVPASCSASRRWRHRHTKTSFPQMS